MKKLSILLFIFLASSGYSQTLPDYDDIDLETGSDFKNADSVALLAANYLLAKPYNSKSMNQLKSIQFLMKWMEGTPDYTFTLDGFIVKVQKENPELFGIYMAAMVKYCLEHKSKSKDVKKVRLNSVKLLLNYAEDPNNNIKMGKTIKRLSKANANGELEAELEK